MVVIRVDRGMLDNVYQFMSDIPLPSLSLSLAYFLSAFLIYQLCSAIYNVTFHPLARIPGPKLAGATMLYQTFWGIYQNKSVFYEHIAHLHQKYGPIIRITPSEISLSDPDDYEKIYHIGTKYYKSAEYYGPFGAPTGIFTAVDNSLHSRRRAPLSPFFSRQSVLNIQSSVQEKIRTLCNRLDAELRINGVAPLHHMFNALSLDVASGYLFNHSFDSLHKENYSIQFTKMVKEVLRAFWIMVQSSVFCKMVKGLPEFITDINPSLKGYHTLFNDTEVIVHQVVAEVSSGKTPSQRSSIFHTLLDPPTTDEYRKPKNYEPPSVQQLTDDGVSFLVAAAVTTGNSMMVSSYHILKNRDIYAHLRKEILENFPLSNGSQQLDFSTVERLPYLTGCIKEGLRLAYGTIGRLPRTIPQGGAIFHGYNLPAGYNIGMSTWIMHRDPGLWPDPNRFDPERWADQAEAKRLNKYLVSFGKDSRNCLGMNLALCEIYLMVATLIREYDDLEVYEMTDDDLVFDDRFGAAQQEHCKKFQVRRTGKSVDFFL